MRNPVLVKVNASFAQGLNCDSSRNPSMIIYDYLWEKIREYINIKGDLIEVPKSELAHCFGNERYWYIEKTIIDESYAKVLLENNHAVEYNDCGWFNDVSLEIFEMKIKDFISAVELFNQ